MQYSIFILLCFYLLTACTSNSRYSQRQDSAPELKPQQLNLQNPIVELTRINPANSRSYQIKGRRYTPQTTLGTYQAIGQASWYGRKFHGHLTANGEIYDMFTMSAAHKTLPIPSYLRVKNLNNQRSVIVRVNDRGPFYDRRLIDLSYAAAYKLDMLKQGTAPVEITTILPERLVIPNIEEYLLKYFIHIQGANESLFIQEKGEALAALLQVNYQVTTGQSYRYYLHLGPLAQNKARQLVNQVHTLGYSEAFVFKATQSL